MLLRSGRMTNNTTNKGEDLMIPQIQTTIGKTTLLQSNVITNTSTPPFSTSRPWGMPHMNIPQINMSIPQSQPIIPLILHSWRMNRNLELEGHVHAYNSEDRMVRDSSMISTRVSNKTLAAFKKQIVQINHKLVNTLTNHMTPILNPLLRIINESYQQINGILDRIEDALAIPINPPVVRPMIHEILTNDQPVQQNVLNDQID